MSYPKYSSIENHYQNKLVNSMLQQCPNTIDMPFQITEKIDGSNFQISITKKSVRFGKRTAWLLPGEGFFDWERVVNKPHIQEFIRKVQEQIPRVDESWDFYGELFGPGVQKRIQYGKDKDILLFDMKVRSQWQSPVVFTDFLKEIDCMDLHVPILGTVNGLEEALAFETQIPTKLFEAHDGTTVTEAQEIEGVVIKPLNEVVLHRTNRIILKKKNEKFKENMGVKHNKKRVPKVVTPLQQEFLGYICENRMAGIVSKHGEPSDSNQIGKYISLIANDAFNDFAKDQDWELSDISKTGRKEYISMVGAVALPLIRAYL